MQVLIAEDDVVYRRVLQKTLSGWGYEVQTAVDGPSALAMLTADEAPQLAILDWVMPGLDGYQVCQAVRERAGPRYAYLLLLTGKNQQTDLVKGLEAGADDYLIKPFDPPELKARLRTGRRILELQDELIAAREALRVQATRDGLTGAWNYRSVTEILDREINRAGREGRPLGVLLIDLDHFKRVNDTHGHLAGDEVLRSAVRCMQAAMRPYDIVGRYGGEEFVIVLPGCDAANTVRWAERVRAEIAAATVVYAEKVIRVTASLGLASYNGVRPTTTTELLHRADTALYQAKNAGRDRVAIDAAR